MSIADARKITTVEDTGATDWFHYDQHQGGFTVETVQDVEPIMEYTKRAMSNARQDWKGDVRHVASIPLVILEQLRKDGILDDQKRYRAWLNDRDNQVFRTHGGKV